MNKIKLFLTALALTGLSMSAKAQSCPNLDFSYGNLTNWQCYAGSSQNQTAQIPGRIDIMNAAVLQQQNMFYDDTIKKVPDGYNFSCRIGSNNRGSEVNGIEYMMTVDSFNTLLELHYAYVMVYAGHPPHEEPQFTMQIKNTAGQILSSFRYDTVIAPWTIYKDWTTAKISLVPFIGQTIKIYLETSGCVVGGHPGYAYVVLDCFPLSNVYNYSATACYGKGYTDANFYNQRVAGTYCKTLQSRKGRDSIVCLNLDFYPSVPLTSYSRTICAGTSYNDSNFHNLTVAGTYYDTLQNTDGCDSIICLTLCLKASISGQVLRQDTTLLNAGLVELYSVQNSGQYILSDTVRISNNGSYQFMNVDTGNYIIKVLPDSSENALSTYYGDTEFWNLATVISVTDCIPIQNIDIVIISIHPLNGNSIISGYVGYGQGQQSLSHKSVDNPVENVNVYLQKELNSAWETVSRTLTNAEGYFEFKKVSVGKYRIILEVLGLDMEDVQVVEIVNDGDSVQIDNYKITEDGIITNTTGIKQLTMENGQLTIYPNPTTGKLHIVLAGATHALPVQVQVYNIAGQSVEMWHAASLQEDGSISIDISHLANGLYFLKVGKKTVKFVKE